MNREVKYIIPICKICSKNHGHELWCFIGKRESLLKRYGQEAAEAFDEWVETKNYPQTTELTGDPVHDYLVNKGRI